MMAPRKNDDEDSASMPLVALARSMDFKIPVWGVLVMLGGLAYWLITMNIQQQQILTQLAELKVAVQAGNSLGATNSGQIAIIQFRLEKVEADHNRMLAMPKNGKE